MTALTSLPYFWGWLASSRCRQSAWQRQQCLTAARMIGPQERELEILFSPWTVGRHKCLKILLFIRLSYHGSQCLILGFLSLLMLSPFLTWISSLFLLSSRFFLSLTRLFWLMLKWKELCCCSWRTEHCCSQGNALFPWVQQDASE